MANSRVLEPPRDLSAQNRLQDSIQENRARLAIVERFTAPPRIPISFSSGWGNYGSGFQTGTYYVDRGRLYLEGLVASSSTSVNIFTLPAGFVPTSQHLFICASSLNGGFTRVDVTSAGLVYMGVAVTAGHWVSLDGINFRL